MVGAGDIDHGVKRKRPPSPSEKGSRCKKAKIASPMETNASSVLPRGRGAPVYRYRHKTPARAYRPDPALRPFVRPMIDLKSTGPNTSFNTPQNTKLYGAPAARGEHCRTMEQAPSAAVLHAGSAMSVSRVHAGWEKHASRRASLASERLLALQTPVQSPGTPPRSARARSTRSGGAVQLISVAPGVPQVLKNCSVLVDVRGPDGDDQGTWFVDTLELLGARVQHRLGSACTHIVFRKGAAKTLQRYKEMPDPRPKVVGVRWVVVCAEQTQVVETGEYQVDVADAYAEAVLREKARTNSQKKGETKSHMAVGIPESKLLAMDEEKEDVTPVDRARKRRQAMEAASVGDK